MWPFSKKIVGKQSRKVALINVADYPKAEYSVYWEIVITGNDKFGYDYEVGIYEYGTGYVLNRIVGHTINRDDADTAAQKWVISNMKKYKRTV